MSVKEIDRLLGVYFHYIFYCLRYAGLGICPCPKSPGPDAFVISGARELMIDCLSVRARTK